MDGTSIGQIFIGGKWLTLNELNVGFSALENQATYYYFILYDFVLQLIPS